MRFVAALFFFATLSAQTTPHTLAYAPGKSITLNLPAGLDIAVAIKGLPRVRFFAQAPDGRIFATSMYNLADNTRGALYILDGWNAKTHTFARAVPYLTHLRNPNNIAFYTDEHKQSWLYLPLTDKLVRYKYFAGDKAPHSPPQVLMRFPDYGLNYKYGGWHLTRTVAVATLHGHTRIYVSAGSSCNYCRELEAQRAAIMVMEPDGSHPQILAHGIRNAVDLRFVPNLDGGALFATDMGDDHLGDKLPEDAFFEIDSNDHPGAVAAVPPDTLSTVNYGWPTCYFANGKAVHDASPLPTNPGPDDKEVAEKPVDKSAAPTHNDSVYGEQQGMTEAGTNLGAHVVNEKNLPSLGPVPEPLTTCKDVPAAYTTFAAHSSPLGLAWFGDDNTVLKNSFLVALHGAGHPSIGTGYRLVRFTPGSHAPEDFINGFLTFAASKPLVHGRPCGLLRTGPDSFLLTDDNLGLVYAIFPSTSAAKESLH